MKTKVTKQKHKATLTLPTYFDVTPDFCSSMVMLVVHIPTTWQCSVLFMSSTGWSRVRSMCMLFLKYWEFKREFQQQQTFCRDEATTPSYGSTLSWEILHRHTTLSTQLFTIQSKPSSCIKSATIQCHDTNPAAALEDDIKWIILPFVKNMGQCWK